jgi:hypothetical protein
VKIGKFKNEQIPSQPLLLERKLLIIKQDGLRTEQAGVNSFQLLPQLPTSFLADNLVGLLLAEQILLPFPIPQ